MSEPLNPRYPEAVAHVNLFRLYLQIECGAYVASELYVSCIQVHGTWSNTFPANGYETRLGLNFGTHNVLHTRYSLSCIGV
jgi:hypothetical protein